MNEFLIEQDEAALEVPLPLISKQRDPFAGQEEDGSPSMTLGTRQQLLILRDKEEEAPATEIEGSAQQN